MLCSCHSVRTTVLRTKKKGCRERAMSDPPSSDERGKQATHTSPPEHHGSEFDPCLEPMLRQALETIPDEYRRVLLLHHDLHLSLEETASRLDVSADEIQRRYRRGLAILTWTLRHRLSGQNTSPGHPVPSGADLGPWLDAVDHVLALCSLRQPVDPTAATHTLKPEVQTVLSCLRALAQLNPLANTPTGPWAREDTKVDFALSGFEVLREIGRGGMGIVYWARQTSLDRDVALKRLPPIFAGNPDRVQRFRTEARAAAKLTGAGIVPVYDVLETQGEFV